MIIEYQTSVYTPAGFRSITVETVAERLTMKRAIVLEVTHCNGQEIAYNMSITGAKRQSYNGFSVNRQEQGKLKNLSSCTIISE